MTLSPQEFQARNIIAIAMRWAAAHCTDLVREMREEDVQDIILGCGEDEEQNREIVGSVIDRMRNRRMEPEAGTEESSQVDTT